MQELVQLHFRLTNLLLYFIFPSKWKQNDSFTFSVNFSSAPKESDNIISSNQEMAEFWLDLK